MLSKLKQLQDSREEGFTLIELLVVIVIIGVLTAIALPIFTNQQKEAMNAGIKSDVRNGVIAVNTALTKDPTLGRSYFTAINDRGVKSGLAVGVGSTPPAIELSISNPNTFLRAFGTIENYTVHAQDFTNSSSTTRYYYRYSSATGKYTEGES